jgi:hypothetical protein
MTSRIGSIGDNGSGHAYAYRTTNAALNMATRNIAHEVPRGEGFCRHRDRATPGLGEDVDGRQRRHGGRQRGGVHIVKRMNGLAGC